MRDTDPTPVITCEKARAAIRDFLRGGMSVARANELRVHRKTCPECDTEYRELVQGVAAISSGARATAETYSRPAPERLAASASADASDDATDVDEEPIEPRARRSLLAAGSGSRFRLPRFFLPLAVGVAFVALSIQAGAPKVTLVASGGDVWKGTKAVETTDPIAMSRFETCVTGVDGHLRLELGSNRILLDPGSSCLVDRLDLLSVRLYEGRARIEGDARLLLPLGAIETKGGVATVAFDATGVSIQNLSGELVYTDGGGRRSLAASETMRVDLPESALEIEPPGSGAAVSKD